ncbi:MAG: RagB/SusD family nutrient uptake outer membrane protein [Bacteroidetes bacterium]|nr:MAG: RagB/SusD family nutrient uptake outer membrane protein [Bacteroidota bacterium]
MKSQYNFLSKIRTVILVSFLLWINACKIDPIPDPNNPSITSITQNASLGEIQNLVDGTESAMRDNLGNYFDGVCVIGREYYRFSTSDPRFTSDLLGKGNATLDSNTFYTTNPFAARYRAIKNANILIEALTNTKASITDEQRKAGIAYAKTIKAYELLLVFNEQYGNGIRVDVSDPDKLGPFLDKDGSLNAIASLLDEANTDLSGQTTEFPFTSTIYTNDAATFSKFNRAIAARVAVYRSDWNGALTALSNSFFDINGPLNKGSYHIFSTAGGDQLNPMFFPLESNGETRVAQPDFVKDAEAGDTRLSKVVQRSDTAFQDGLSSNYDFYLYTSNTANIPLIRNEELILIYAEANIQLNNLTEGRDALNKIRTAASLPNYSGALTQDALIDEMLKQRRYSLYGEGHRWVDMRRYNRLDQLPIDRPGDDVWVQFPRPTNE